MHETHPEVPIPTGLQRAIPRPVRLTAGGVAVAVLAVALLGGAVLAGWVANREARNSAARRALFEREAVAGTAEVTALERVKDNARRVYFRYSAGGGIFTGRQTLKRRNWRGLRAGSQIPIRYLPSDPSVAYIRGGPKVLPLWAGPVIAAILAAVAALLAWAIRRQWRLLAEGRTASGRIAGSKNLGRHGHRVEYQFRTLSGSLAKGFFQCSKTPPPPGSGLLVLYDRERPSRSALYPFSLIQLK